MATVSLAPDFRSLSRQPPPDPDIQATLSDYLTYTEHFPSHLTRSLTLIGEQRARSESKIKAVHDGTATYGDLPNIRENKPDPAQLRRDISYALEEAERSSRMAVEEATRLDSQARREAKNLDIVLERLRAQPMPPSRDPTPEQQALTSPNLKRERRMSTRAEDVKAEKSSRKLDDKAASKLRGRKIMVPGEVLPPPDPNAPVESISGLTSSRASPSLDLLAVPVPEKREAAAPRQRSRTPKVPKPEKEKKDKSRVSRPAGQPGTNAHSSVAGISTSNALLALTHPPEDAVKGSKWMPWMKLTEWEMARLRKRMKKNAIWVPSQTMVRRELRNLGRGKDGKEEARKRAEETGEQFTDEHSEEDPTRLLISGQESAEINALLGTEAVYGDEGGEDADQELINRGMRLNEAKKLKRQRMLEEQALQAQLAREQGVEVPAVDPKVAAADAKDSKKRKRDTTPAANVPSAVPDTPDPLSKAGPAPKRLKLAPAPQPAPVTSKVPLAPATSKVPLAPAGPSSSPKNTNRSRRAATPPVKRPTLIIKPGKAVSEEPPNRRASLRRSSNASLPNATPTSPRTNTKTSGRKSRRPAPGILTNNDDESAKVGVSKRKAAPRKKGGAGSGIKPPAAATSSDPVVPEEYIDPDEPRYCICGDVSWGTMIACDNEESCEKEWFHLDCVDLTDLPPRRTKWFCPDCRKKLKMGQGSNGLVGRTGTGR